MTVAELIERLNRYPGNLPVTVDSGDNSHYPSHRESPELALETLVVEHTGSGRFWGGRYERLGSLEERERQGLALPECAFLALHITPAEPPLDGGDHGDTDCNHRLPPREPLPPLRTPHHGFAERAAMGPLPTPTLDRLEKEKSYDPPQEFGGVTLFVRAKDESGNVYELVGPEGKALDGWEPVEPEE